MSQDKYFFKISPEVLQKDIIEKNYDDIDFGLYKPIEYVLQNGFIQELNFTISLSQDVKDIGFYTPFDGTVEQLNQITNFVISGNPMNVYQIVFFDTSIKEGKVNIGSEFTIDWGDGISEQINPFLYDSVTHNYPLEDGDYTITYTRKNKWGEAKIQKTISIPINPSNIEGEVVYENEPFIISGFTSSKLNELKLYGQIKYETLRPIIKKGEFYGQITEMNDQYTAYTVNEIDYFDYPDGTTIYFVESYGLNEDNQVYSGTTKEEVLLGIVDSPEIQSEVFIDRGKLSGLESLQRLGEIDNIGDLQNYGYKYFKINNQ